MNVQQVIVRGVPQVMDLLCTCFAEDGYYKRLFPDAATREQQMRQAFAEDVLYCVEQGFCTGVYDDERLVAFSLVLDYGALLQDEVRFGRIFSGTPSQPGPHYNARLHSTVGALSGRVIFLLSLAVHPDYRGWGLGAALVDRLMTTYPDCHFAGDVSNAASLPLYRKRGFTVEELESGYHLVLRRADAPLSDVVEEQAEVLVADTEVLDRHHIPYTLHKERAVVMDAVSKDGRFVSRAGQVAVGCRVVLSYAGYLQYQRIIGLSVCTERQYGAVMCLIQQNDLPTDPLINDTLREMLPRRQAEWATVPDVFVSLPVQYSDRTLLTEEIPDEQAAYLLRMLDFRTHYEMGVQTHTDGVDDCARCKERIRRYYLGKLPLCITAEATSERYDAVGEQIGGFGYVDMYITIDTHSDCAVLSWYTLSTPFLISHYFDNIIRNQVLVKTPDRLVNLFAYIKERYGLTKQGTPKIFTVLPQDKDTLTVSQKASLLVAETIYPDGENFGGIVDAEILDIVRSETGMGQYDRAYMYAYSNVVLQFSPDLRATVRERLFEESITQFFIELILFQEAAIHVADNAIVRLLAQDRINHPEDFLRQVDEIHDRYSKTIVFWDVDVNYPTSQMSLRVLRRAFRIKEQQRRMMEDQEYLNDVFGIKCDLADRGSDKRLNTALALISVLSVFSALVDGGAITEWLFPYVGYAAYAVPALVAGIFAYAMYALFKKSEK